MFFDQKILQKEVSYEKASDLGYCGMEAGCDEIEEIFYDGEAYEGKATKVFAYLGVPKHSDGEKLPAIILVHGGGGSAFCHWVKRWVDMGFCAIAMDLTGTYPEHAPKDEADLKRISHAFSGPDNDEYQTISPKESVWMYHAVCDVIYAHNLLRGLPFVDNENIGITGISWGGVVTSTVLGIDNRFKYAVPVFGCGYLYEMENKTTQYMTPDKKDWDPSGFLANCHVPTFWINGDKDESFTVSGFSKSAKTVKGESAISIKRGFGHSHTHGWDLSPELYSYIMHKAKGAAPLISFGEILFDGKNAVVELNVPKERNVLNVTLVAINTDDVFNPLYKETAYAQVEGERDGNRYSFCVPDDAIRFYIYAKDTDENTTSTFIYEIDNK